MRLPFALGLVMVLALGNAGRGASFTGISSFGTTYAQRISADGSTVVGRIEDANGNVYPYYWSSAIGLNTLDNSGNLSARAFAVSADGSLIAGHSRVDASNSYAASWERDQNYLNTTQFYDWNTGYYANFSQIDAMSADGRVAVGYGTFPIPIVEDVDYTQAFVYYPYGDYPSTTLGDLSGGENYSKARDITPDGFTIVGLATSALGREAFRSSPWGPMVGLGDLPGGAYSSEARGVSANGAVIVGAATSAAGPEAFRWNEAGGMLGLGDLPGGGFSSSAWGVSADGGVVVGEGRTAAGRTAFLWDGTHGMRDLNRVLTDDYGVDLQGWHLSQAMSIDASGKIITGNGVNPQGESQAWVVDLNQRLRFTATDYSELFTYEPRGDWQWGFNAISVPYPSDSGELMFTAETPLVRVTNPDAFAVEFRLTTFKSSQFTADRFSVDIVSEDGTFVREIWDWSNTSEQDFVDEPIRALAPPGVLSRASRYKVRIRYSDSDGNFSLGPLHISNLELLEAELALSVTGDADGDGDVDLTDLNYVRNNFGASGAGIQGDTNGDQLVDLVDLNNVRNHFGEGSSVPEPSAIAMLLVSACALAAGRLARMKKS